LPIIEVKDLVKEYRVSEKKEGLRGAVLNLFNPKFKVKRAVNNISFSIGEGEMVGYIGANGAGKSTTIKMLTGILTPTSGEVLINGLVPQKNRIKNNMDIGAVFGQRTQLWWDLPVIESYKLIQKIYEVPMDRYNYNLKKYSDLLELDELLKIPVRQLSLGQKMRCEIAAAFIHDPKIVYLDEPTIGLDVVVKDKIREFIKALNKEMNTTVILTTHDLQDIEEICKRVIIIDDGAIIYDGSLEEIKNKFGRYRTVHFKVKNLNKDIEGVIKENSHMADIMEMDEYNLKIKFNREKITAAGIMNLVTPHCNIIDLTLQEPSIESIVKDLYGK